MVASVVPAQADTGTAASVASGELTAAVRLLTPHVHRQADGTFALRASARVVGEVGAERFAAIDGSMHRVKRHDRER
jgi:hypothetical protein